MALMPILNPLGIVEPAHLGQMFFDQTSEVFYQARGRTAADWTLVAPADMVGTFVKIYDHFLGLPQDDPQGPEVRQRVADAEAVRKTMEIDGVVLFGAFRWKTAAGADVAMIRVRFDRPDGLSTFFGFANDPVAHELPAGIGLGTEDRTITFCGEVASLEPRKVVALRVEATAEQATAFVDDRPLAQVPGWGDIPASSVFASFVRRPGRRHTAPGYDLALQRRMKR